MRLSEMALGILAEVAAVLVLGAVAALISLALAG